MWTLPSTFLCLLAVKFDLWVLDEPHLPRNHVSYILRHHSIIPWLVIDYANNDSCVLHPTSVTSQ